MRPPTGHFKKHLEEVCPNHMYPISHRFKDYGMMTSFMTSGSLTWGIELDEGLDGGHTMPFPKENAIMRVYEGCPVPRRCRVSTLSPWAPWGGGRDVMGHVFHYPSKYICIYIY
jgi:hypothetical protein